MPRTRGKKTTKASPKKAAATNEEEENVNSEATEAPKQEQNDSVMESEDVPAVDNGEVTEDLSTKEEPVKEKDEPIVQDETMDTEEQGKDDVIEEPKAPVYQPHTFPSFTNKSLIEKWEWHIRVFPIDQADIRSCVLESVSKIAQETWMYIDNQNYGMGAYDLCVKNAADASTIMLKTLAMPMSYRYLTVKVTHRAKNAGEVKKINKKKASMKDDENDLDEELDNLPFTEVIEKATLLLDYTQTYVINKVKGQEKKRNLYVKYLPDNTSKELLKVLFPVANNLDIIKTAKGRRVGEVNVSTIPNIIGICNAYVTTHINGRRNITLDWKEENIEDNRLVQESYAEIPWEIIPRDFEYPYETVPYIEKDELTEYGRRRKREENQRERERDRDRSGRRRLNRPEFENVLRMQHEMNERINSQVALLAAVGSAPPPPPSLMGIGPGFPGPPLPPPPGNFRRDRRDDRRGDRGGRERRNSSGGRGADKKPVDKGEKKSRWDKSEDTKAETREEETPQKDVQDKEKKIGRDAGSPQGPGRKFDGGRFNGQSGWRGGDEGRWGRYDDQMRGGYPRQGGRRFDDSRRGGGRFEGRGGRFEGRGGGRFDNFGRMGGGMFEGDGRPGMMGEAPGMDMGRGGRFDRGGRGGGSGGGGGGGFGSGFKRGGNKGNMKNMGMDDNYQGYGNQSGGMQNQGGFGNQMGDGGYGNNKSNRFGGFMNQGGNQPDDNLGQSGGYGNQSNQSSGYGNQQNQSGGYGNQQNMSGSYNQQSSSMGNQQNQSSGFGNMSMQGGGNYGGQNKTGGFNNQSKQTGNYGNQSSTANFAYSTQNSMAMSGQQGGYGGTQDTTAMSNIGGGMGKTQSSYGSTAQSGYTSQDSMSRQSNLGQTGMNMQKAQIPSKAQSGMGTMGSLNQQNVGSMGTQQSLSGMGTQNQTMGMSQGNYGTTQQSGFSNQGTYGNQSYGSYDDGSYQQNYMNQQVYGGYSATDNSGGWSQPQGDYSQYSTQTQDTMNQANYSTGSLGQTDSYNTSSYNNQSTGYSADAAFANQGFYAAPQGNTATGSYGEYSTQDQSAAYATGTTSNLSNMATYNFASYNTGS